MIADDGQFQRTWQHSVLNDVSIKSNSQACRVPGMMASVAGILWCWGQYYGKATRLSGYTTKNPSFHNLATGTVLEGCTAR